MYTVYLVLYQQAMCRKYLERPIKNHLVWTKSTPIAVGHWILHMIDCVINDLMTYYTFMKAQMSKTVLVSGPTAPSMEECTNTMWLVAKENIRIFESTFSLGDFYKWGHKHDGKEHICIWDLYSI